MALSADAQTTIKTRTQAAVQAANAAAIFAGGELALVTRNHPTSGLRGRVRPWTSALHEIPLGRAIRGVTGNTAATPIPEGEASIDGEIRTAVPVTGVTGQADVGRMVYFSDDATLTLTRPTIGIPRGMVTRFYSEITCDVYLFGLGELLAIQAAGAGQYTWFMGAVTGVAAGPGNVATGIEAPHHGRITKVYGMVIQPLATAAAALTYNLEINGTDLAGGAVAVVLADAAGSKKAGTAVTGDNTFHEGDLIDIEVAVGSASTAGLVGIYAEVQTDFGL